MAPFLSAKLVSVVASTGDKKLSHNGNMAATWIPQASCHDDCSLKHNGCYAEMGNAGFQTSRLNKGAAKASLGRNALRVLLAKQEAKLIDELPAKKKLRVHVVGDCATATTAGIVGAAMTRYEKRGQIAYTYTHSWRRFRASAWRGARVMASVEQLADIPKARKMGYKGIALIVPPHPTHRVYQLGDVNVVPCPAQFFVKGRVITDHSVSGARRMTTCEKCGLCQHADVLHERNMVIGFAPDHGTSKKVLPLIQ